MIAAPRNFSPISFVIQHICRMFGDEMTGWLKQHAKA